MNMMPLKVDFSLVSNAGRTTLSLRSMDAEPLILSNAIRTIRNGFTTNLVKSSMNLGKVQLLFDYSILNNKGWRPAKYAAKCPQPQMYTYHTHIQEGDVIVRPFNSTGPVRKNKCSD